MEKERFLQMYKQKEIYEVHVEDPIFLSELDPSDSPSNHIKPSIKIRVYQKLRPLSSTANYLPTRNFGESLEDATEIGASDAIHKIDKVIRILSNRKMPDPSSDHNREIERKISCLEELKKSLPKPEITFIDYEGFSHNEYGVEKGDKFIALRPHEAMSPMKEQDKSSDPIYLTVDVEEIDVKVYIVENGKVVVETNVYINHKEIGDIRFRLEDDLSTLYPGCWVLNYMLEDTMLIFSCRRTASEALSQISKRIKDLANKLCQEG